MSLGTSEAVRFQFGANWKAFLGTIDEHRISLAIESFTRLIGDRSFSNKSMLDVGCGSGLSSLAARRLGLTVHAFDYDARSVAASKDLRSAFINDDLDWIIEEGDILDRNYIDSLGTYDVVYSWGVLHHTGDMWRAIENAMVCVAPRGLFAIAIYNDQGGTSRRWRAVKRFYNRLPRALQPPLVAACLPIQWWKDILEGTLRGRPLRAWHAYARERGMSPWHDMVDWVGGYPFEVAKPEEVLEFCKARGFALEKLKTCGGGIGCNEFVFVRA
jgi:2-polyprenyl-6-hydroxyphenyl methylase/3-demethylubiquinone-9 3-methyltransferase